MAGCPAFRKQEFLPMHHSSNIAQLSVEEREQLFIAVGRLLDGAALESMAEGNRKFGVLSKTMAEAILLNADELARDDVRHAENVLRQANELIKQFGASHPYRMLSYSVH